MPRFPTTETNHQGAAHLLMTCPRLQGREPFVVAALVVSVWIIAPKWATWISRPDFPEHYRTPYWASEDYWRYRQLTSVARQRDQILVVGDSVIWGEYVDVEQTLSAALNRRLEADRFVNGGVNGLHPLAMQGLLRHYGQPLRGRAVLVHCNLLWLTSAERDLSEDRGLSFNHPRLVPQFRRTLGGYQADSQDRVSVFVEQHVPFRQWVRHLWIEYLDGQDLPTWTLEHPYAIPSRHASSDTDRTTRQRPVSWEERRIPAQSFAWIDASTSQQWRALRETIGELQRQEARVFVLVGPFNAHLLTESSRASWLELRSEVTRWLSEHMIPHASPAVLPSALYADASHPLAEGYQQLAAALQADPAFTTWARSEPTGR